jgi:hypothetical protein
MDKFLELFQVKIYPTEVLKEYYSLQQQGGESVVSCHLGHGGHAASSGHLGTTTVFLCLLSYFRNIWLTALMDASTVPLMEIVNRALNLDHQQLGLDLSQFRAIVPSPKTEEKTFQ